MVGMHVKVSSPGESIEVQFGNVDAVIYLTIGAVRAVRDQNELAARLRAEGSEAVVPTYKPPSGDDFLSRLQPTLDRAWRTLADLRYMPAAHVDRVRAREILGDMQDWVSTWRIRRSGNRADDPLELPEWLIAHGAELARIGVRLRHHDTEARLAAKLASPSPARIRWRGLEVAEKKKCVLSFANRATSRCQLARIVAENVEGTSAEGIERAVRRLEKKDPSFGTAVHGMFAVQREKGRSRGTVP